MDWVRLYHDMPADPKWRVIAKRAGQRIGDVIAVYVFLLCNASRNTEERGVTQGFVSEDVAAAIDLDESCVTAVLDAMEGKVVKKGRLLGWEKRNPKREDSSTDRVRKHRETQSNAPKRPESEVDTEKKEPSLRSGSPARRTRRQLPDGFPEKPDLDWATEFWIKLGRTDLAGQIGEEVAKFRDHHGGKLTTSADWPGSWRTWVRNAVKFNSGAHSARPEAKILKVV